MSARKPRIGRPKRARCTENADVRKFPADFRDAESVRVLDAAADALVLELARQAARDFFADWLAMHKGLRNARRSLRSIQQRQAEAIVD
jgi:hypothetical protein